MKKRNKSLVLWQKGDMENEIRSMLRHYYKQLKIKKDLDKIKPVIE